MLGLVVVGKEVGVLVVVDRDIAGFAQYLSARLSARSVRAYVFDIEEFFAWLPPDADAYISATVETYAKWLLGKAAVATSHRKLCALRAYYRYLVFVGVIPKNPAAGVSLGGYSTPLPVVLDPATIQTVLLGRRESSSLETRGHALVWLIWETMAKIGEAAALNGRDVEVYESAGTVRLRGRNGERASALSAEGSEALYAYASVRAGGDAGPFFSNRFGSRLTARSLRKAVAAIGWQRANRRVSATMIRHTRALALYRGGLSPRELGTRLGYSEPAITAVNTYRPLLSGMQNKSGNRLQSCTTQNRV
jgi:integrase/recombinase XerC